MQLYVLISIMLDFVHAASSITKVLLMLLLHCVRQRLAIKGILGTIIIVWELLDIHCMCNQGLAAVTKYTSCCMTLTIIRPLGHNNCNLSQVLMAWTPIVPASVML